MGKISRRQIAATRHPEIRFPPRRRSPYNAPTLARLPIKPSACRIPSSLFLKGREEIRRTMLKPYVNHLMLAAAVMAGTALGTHAVHASDHDDGTSDYKTLNTNFTDLFVFNEQTHIDGTAPAGNTNVVMVMNVNPRALPQQQYFFHTTALYDFNVRRISGANNEPIAASASVPNLTIRFQFGPPDDNSQQAMTVSLIRDGVVISSVSQATARTKVGTATSLGAGNIVTTAHPFVAPPTGTDAGVANDANGVARRVYATDTAIRNDFQLNGQGVEVFAGLREDPFFFDVDKYFRVRAAAARAEYNVIFQAQNAVDFTTGYNVLSIVLKAPRALLQDTGTETTFDVWETIQAKV